MIILRIEYCTVSCQLLTVVCPGRPGISQSGQHGGAPRTDMYVRRLAVVGAIIIMVGNVGFWPAFPTACRNIPRFSGILQTQDCVRTHRGLSTRPAFVLLLYLHPRRPHTHARTHTRTHAHTRTSASRPRCIVACGSLSCLRVSDRCYMLCTLTQ